MNCPDCGVPAVVFEVPEELREYAPRKTDTAALCSRCLSLFAEPEESPGNRELGAISGAFPDHGGPAMALLLGLLSSLALNRREIESLRERLESEGVDVLLTLDRLDGDRSLDPAVDLGRRRHQLEQLGGS